MNRTKKLIKNTGIFFIGNFSSKLLNLILVPIYMAYLSPENFGTINLLILLSSILMITFSIDITDGVFRFLLNDNYNREKVLFNSLFIYIFGYLVLIIFLIFINIKYSIPYFKIFLLHIYFTNFVTFLLYVLRGIKKNVVYAISGIINSFVQAIMNIILIVKFDFNSISILISAIGASLITIVFIFTRVNFFKIFRLHYFDFTLIKKFFRYSFPLMLGLLLLWIINNFSIYIFSYYDNKNYYSGLYSMGLKFVGLFNGMIAIFMLAWNELSIEEFSKSDYSNFFQNIYNNFIVFCLYLVSIFILSINLYFRLSLANKYMLIKFYIPLMVMASLFQSFGHFLNSSFIATEKTKNIFYINLIVACISIPLNLIFIYFFKLLGGCISYLISSIIFYLLSIKKVNSVLILKSINKKIFSAFIYLITIYIIFIIDNFILVLCFLFISVLLVFIKFLSFVKEMPKVGPTSRTN